ncbi:SDR family oxidoreductase [Stigmatella sp. ncwal1]|uniref:SDR family oxidoreductase n=1 Tax=Stigmatella ashevillensis TaxID=2995309 RepID=A0ABT5D3Y7_9BACT|nr:SDR family oxidoreductase [Stigmatella ashevillena]MDC0707553.1 SDR family oxidoreductase [Stigmatella ashevillena]
MNRFDFAGKTVLITGASMGLGAEFARQLSRLGATLVLVARSEAKLQALATELGKAHVITADLAAPGAAQRLFEAVTAQAIDVDVLINNAGFGLHGDFGTLPLAGQREEIDLNVGALVELTYLFLPMLERRQGGVIQLASVAAYQPTPYMSVYGATKAFVLSFSEALWAEYQAKGLRVLCLSPGATDTPFFQRAGGLTPPGTKARPEDVVRTGLAAFIAGRPSAMHGFANQLLMLTARLFSRAFVAKIVARIAKPKAPVLLPPSTDKR